MARKPRIEFPGAFYHVFSRGNQKQDVFLSEADYKIFLKRLAEYKKEYGFPLYAYTLMKNHFHLLLETREVGLSKIMQGLLQSYTQYHNLKYKKVGHLFQGRYRAILCQRDLYLLELIRYLHLNCVRAGYVSHPNSYKWSSYDAYLKGDGGLVDVDLALKFFSEDKATAMKKYNVFINDGIDMPSHEKFYAVVDQRFLGSEAFIKNVVWEEEKAVKSAGSKACGFDDIWSAIEKVYDLRKRDVVGRSRNNNVLAARAAFVHLCKKFGNKKGLEIAAEIGRDPAVVTTLSKLDNVPLIDKVERRLINSITQV